MKDTAEQLNSNVTALAGTVEKITYRNDANYYTVAQVKTKDGETTVVGILPFLNEGDEAVFSGIYTVHSVYGQQFKAESYENVMPKTTAAILKYLSSGAIKGVGPATAQRIVERFGDESLNIIQNEPQRLSVIKGISSDRAIEISKEYSKHYGIKDIMLMLSKYNVTPERCLAIYRRFGTKSADTIKANPYILCEDGIDFRFETVEEIAEDLSFSKKSELRISAGLEYVLRKNLANGHTCLPRKKFTEVSSRLLECNIDVAENCCDRLIECFRVNSKIIGKEEFISLPEYYAAEEHIAACLASVKRHINQQVTIDELEIDNVERILNIKFEELQRQAILEAFSNGVLVLTGGPGTGKTTTLNAIIRLFENRGLDIELTAPTGRAAKRMAELTGKEAQTIHRLLEAEWTSDEKRQFARNEKNPLSCDVIIIDEASMIDALLFDDLLRALRPSCRIIVVGDSDQLPSIGAGNLLNDILSCDLFPAIRLKKVFRQASKSQIVTNAHAIINSQTPDFSNKDSDCYFIKKYDKYEVNDSILQLISERLPTAYNFDSINDIQVLCPSRMLENGSLRLNALLQEKLNPLKKGEPQLAFKGQYLRLGDKVMQIKNNYDLQFKKDNGEYGTGVFNGDVGFITDIDLRAGILKVRYEDRVATYFGEDLGQIELAYAITVHKSQGSEYDCVVLPLCDVPEKLKYRNLLYTAVTRAKKMLVIVGSENVWYQMAGNERKTLRYTQLTEFLAENREYAKE